MSAGIAEPVDVAKELKNAIALKIWCIKQPYLNAFAGTGRSRKRSIQSVHSIAKQIMERTFIPFSFRWNFGNHEPAEHTDIYLTVFTTLADIDDEDARRWSNRLERDVAREEAAKNIARALMRKFIVTKRELIVIPGEGPHGVQTRYAD